MSNDEYLRRRVQEQMQQNPQTEKVEPYKIGNTHDAEVINAEIERLRRERELGN